VKSHKGHRGRMVVGFITTWADTAYHLAGWNPAHSELYSIQHYVTICGRSWFSPGTMVFSTNKTDRHNITEILLIWFIGTKHHNHNPRKSLPPFSHLKTFWRETTRVISGLILLIISISLHVWPHPAIVPIEGAVLFELHVW